MSGPGRVAGRFSGTRIGKVGGRSRMSRNEVTSDGVRGAVVGVAVTFGLNGVAVASWFARVPAARDALGLGAGALGLLLLAMSAGATLAMLTAGEVTHRLVGLC